MALSDSYLNAFLSCPISFYTGHGPKQSKEVMNAAG